MISSRRPSEWVRDLLLKTVLVGEADHVCRYTKALDNIKALRKERTAELKVDKERLKFLKSDKDKAERVRKVETRHSRLG